MAREQIPQEFLLQTPEQVSALAHPLRLRILNLLHEEPHTNSQLAEALGESRAPALSRT